MAIDPCWWEFTEFDNSIKKMHGQLINTQTYIHE
jgi:hypothetical protein